MTKDANDRAATRTPPVEPPDCFARIGRIRGELEILRVEMGRPADGAVELSVKGAQPREAYFAALALFRKADRFCFEQTGEQAQLPYPPRVGDLTPGDVLAVLDAALDRLRRVKVRLGIGEDAPEPVRDGSKTPSDVCQSVLAANHQINGLLAQEFAPADVYQQLGLASGYTSSVLGAIGQTAATPALPNFERKKRPSDCFRRIGAMIDRVEVIVARAGLSMFDLTVGAVNPDRVLPSDVYDLASLLVSELAYLHGRLPGALPPIVPTYAQQVSRLPAHVYQLAGLVESQLAALQSAIEAKPHALER